MFFKYIIVQNANEFFARNMRIMNMIFVSYVVGRLKKLNWKIWKKKKKRACDEETLNTLEKILKRVNRLEREVLMIKKTIQVRLCMETENEKELKKWNEWTRKIIKEIIKYLFVVICALVGAKIAGI